MSTNTATEIGFIHILTKLPSHHNTLSLKYKLKPPVIVIILYLFSQCNYLIHIRTQIILMISMSTIMTIDSSLKLHVNTIKVTTQNVIKQTKQLITNLKTELLHHNMNHYCYRKNCHLLLQKYIISD